MNFKTRFLFSTVIALSAVSCHKPLPPPQAPPEKALSQRFEWKSPESVGSYSGVTIRMGGLSGLDYIPGSQLEFWTITDRGPNIDASEIKEDAVVFPVPTFTPTAIQFQLLGDSVKIIAEIPLRRPDGSLASGLPPEVGFGGTGEEGWANAKGKVLNTDPWGTDCESIAQGLDGNDFWVGEEYGTLIWHIDKATGKVINRYTPVPKAPEDRLIDSTFRLREPNKGFECMTITPSGKIIAIVQSPLYNPDEETGKNSLIHRIILLDPQSGKWQTFAYLHEKPEPGKKNRRSLGDMTAVNESEFLVIEHYAKNGENIKKVWKINLAQARPITSDNFDGKSLEALADSAGLAAHHIRPVEKKMYFDLLANGWDPALDKPEGITIIDDTTIALLNDNDFGLTSERGNIAITAVGSYIYIWKLPQTMKLNFVRRKIKGL